MFQYSVETGETLQLTSSLQYIIPTKDTIILGAISKDKGKALGPEI